MDERTLASPWAAEEDGFTAQRIYQRVPLAWRDDGRDHVAVFRPDTGAWRRLRAHYRPLLEGVEAEKRPGQLVRMILASRPDLTEAQARAFVKKALGRLIHWGILEVELPENPSSFVGRYNVVRELGRGGMGVVWLCEDRARDDALVAIKNAWSWKGNFVSRERSLREEAAVLAQLDHPAIVRYLGSFEVEGRLHLVREYIPGTKLSQRVRDGPIPEERRIAFLRVIAETTEHLLESGFMILDLKPGNYFVTEGDSSIKLGDLGVCKPLSNGERRVRGAMATRMYNPPEVIRDRVIDERVLVFVLGVSACQLVTARPVSPAATPEEWARRLELVRPILEERASARELRFFDACCAPRPEDRPATISDAIALLDGGG